MTLPADGAKFAEAYFVVDLPSLRTTPFSELQRSDRRRAASIEVDRARRCRSASSSARRIGRRCSPKRIDSVRATGYPCEIVVVNDGGAHAGARRRRRSSTTRRRAAVPRRRTPACARRTNAFIAFLDDDDLFYPEHLATLANAAAIGVTSAGTRDAVSAFLAIGENGSLRNALAAAPFRAGLRPRAAARSTTTSRCRRSSSHATTFLELGGFDPALRSLRGLGFPDPPLAARRLPARSAHHLRIRHFEGGSSVVLAAPEGSPRFRAAKLQVWRKHSALIDNDVLANAFERQKRRGGALVFGVRGSEGTARDAAAIGDRAHARGTRIETSNRINGYALRVRELESALEATQARPRPRRTRTPSRCRISRAAGRQDRHRTSTRENGDLRAANSASRRRRRAAARRDRAPQRSARHDLSLAHLEAAHDDREVARTRMSRVLLVCPEPLGHGPAGRHRHPFLEIARVLRADGHERDVLSPDAGASRAVARGLLDPFAPPARPATSPSCRAMSRTLSFSTRMPIPTVVDLYDPFIIENLHYYAERGAEVFQHDHATLMESLPRGDFFSAPRRRSGSSTSACCSPPGA